MERAELVDWTDRSQVFLSTVQIACWKNKSVHDEGFRMRVSPALVLFFLAPAMGELLVGSAPPSEFFNPFSLILLSSLYGSGALIVRELKVRWKKTYVSMFILGSAYGVIEEGLMVKSFFDPGWMDLGILAEYGRWLGLNWVWAEWLTIYHAIFSISIPITLVELAYAGRRNESWVGNRRLFGLILVLGGVTALGYFGLTDYRPPSVQYLSAVASVVILILLAWKVSPGTGKTGSFLPPKPSRIALAGFLAGSSLFLLFMAGPHLIPEPLVLMSLGAVLVSLTFSLLKRYEWDDRTFYHKFSLIAGAVAFLIALTPLQELDRSRPDNPQGMLIVGIAAVILLLLLRRKLRKEQKSLRLA